MINNDKLYGDRRDGWREAIDYLLVKSRDRLHRDINDKRKKLKDNFTDNV